MMSSEQRVTLKSADEESFEVDQSVALQSQTIKHMIEAGFADTVFPLPSVTGKILEKVIEYCKEHADSPPADDRLKNWDAEFVNVDQSTLFDLILAANDLEIKGLLDLTCETVANEIKKKPLCQIRRMFNRRNTFDPEEEEEFLRENQWAFE